MPPDSRQPELKEQPTNPWLFVVLGAFLGASMGWLRVQAVPQTGSLADLEVLPRLFVDMPLLALLGALIGGAFALLSVASARQQERWRQEDEAREKQKRQQENK